ncbi:MAG: curli assembly protein CsgF [Pseudomonadales bacterium]|nr:curli assembly protein CsgF [Pseudomonadales bacterium]
MKKKLIIIAQTQLLFLVSSIFLSTQLWASGLEYTPVNPSFGGNPLNGNTLLNSAQSQNKTKDPSLDANGDALEDFNDRLQRALLTRLTRSVTASIVDDLGNLIPGETITTDFIIDVVDQGDGTLSVTTTDRSTGDSTIFVVESGF